MGEGEPSPTERVYRSLGTPYGSRPDAEMDVIGWSVFLGMVVLLLPLLPLLILVWLITRGLDALSRRR